MFAASSLGGLGLTDGVTIGGQFGVQLVGVVATVVWSGAISYVVLKLLDATIGLRVSAEQETEGLDVISHEERGYIL